MDTFPPPKFVLPPPRNNISGWPCVLVYPTQVWIDCSRSYIVKQPLHARYWIIEICFRLCLFLTTLSFVNPYFKFILHLNITLSAISVYLYSCCTKTLRWKKKLKLLWPEELLEIEKQIETWCIFQYWAINRYFESFKILIVLFVKKVIWSGCKISFTFTAFTPNFGESGSQLEVCPRGNYQSSVSQVK